MAPLLLCIALVLLSLIAPTTLSNDSELNHGENCGTGVERKCNTSKLLICSTSRICECVSYKPYYAEIDKCVEGVGNECATNELPEIDCPKYASCVEDDTVLGVRLPKQVVRVISTRDRSVGMMQCKCNLGYVTLFNECTPAIRGTFLLYGEKCTFLKFGQDSCDPARNLMCSEATNTCNCTTKSLSHDVGLQACVVPLGAKCDEDGLPGQCVQNGICSKMFERITSVIKNTEFSDRLWNNGEPYKVDESICICLPGYNSNSAGECVGSYNSQCSLRQPCNTERFLECVNGACRCVQGRIMEYRMGKYSKCMLKLGATCSVAGQSNKPSPACIPECECKSGKCRVRDSETWKRRFGIKLSFGKNCTVNKLSGTRMCDASKGLACIGDRSCNCFDQSLTWNNLQKRCLAKEGEKCGHFNLADNNVHITFHPLIPQTESNQFSTPDEPFYVDCVKGFWCIFQPDALSSQCEKIK